MIRPAQRRAKASRAARLAAWRSGRKPVSLRAALIGSGQSETEFLAKVHWQVTGAIACLGSIVKDAHGIDQGAFLAIVPSALCGDCLVALARSEADAAAGREAARHADRLGDEARAA